MATDRSSTSRPIPSARLAARHERFRRRDGLELTIASATKRNSRSKSVLAHRWLATAGLGIALGRLCDSPAQAGPRTKAVVPSPGRTRLDLVARTSDELLGTAEIRTPAFRRSARARAIVRPVAATSVPAGRGSARASTRMGYPFHSGAGACAPPDQTLRGMAATVHGWPGGLCRHARRLWDDHVSRLRPARFRTQRSGHGTT